MARCLRTRAEGKNIASCTTKHPLGGSYGPRDALDNGVLRDDGVIKGGMHNRHYTTADYRDSRQYDLLTSSGNMQLRSPLCAPFVRAASGVGEREIAPQVIPTEILSRPFAASRRKFYLLSGKKLGAHTEKKMFNICRYNCIEKLLL